MIGSIIGWALILMILFAFLIRTSTFQTFLASKATDYLSKELKTDVKIDFKDPELNPTWNNILERAEKLATKKWMKQQGNQEVN